MDSVPSQESHIIAIRCKQGIFIQDWKAKNDQDAVQLSQEGTSSSFQFSNNGEFIWIMEKQRVIVFELHSYKPVAQLEGAQILNATLSPTNQYIQVLEKMAQDHFILHLLQFPSLNKIHQFTYTRNRKEVWPFLKFANKDKYFFRITLEKILECYESQSLKQIISSNVSPCEYVSVQPIASENFLFICYSYKTELTLQNSDGVLKIFQFNSPSKPIFNKPIPDASELEILWSPNGEKVLMQKNTSEDRTNQSYYGATSLYLYDDKKFNFYEIPTYEGPIHNIAWNPNSKEFIVLSGFMPAGAVLLDANGKPQFELGKDHKNTIKWSPLQRFALICGFGTLDGSIDIWDTIQLKKIGVCKLKSTSLCVWSPCGRKFLCGKVTPRMNVDNSYTIFDYHGDEILSRSFSHTELYDVQFAPNKSFCDRPPSPKKQQEQKQENPQPQKKLFIPPGGSGGKLAQQLRQQKQAEGARILDTTETFGNSQQQQGGSWGLQRKPQENYPPGFVPPEKKEKKKRVRKRKDKDDDDDQ